MLLRLFLLGVALMVGALGLLAALSANGLGSPGLTLVLECAFFFAAFPTLMGLFVSPLPEDAGKQVADREFRKAYLLRR